MIDDSSFRAVLAGFETLVLAFAIVCMVWVTIAEFRGRRHAVPMLVQIGYLIVTVAACCWLLGALFRHVRT
jgi:hypothetical protein